MSGTSQNAPARRDRAWVEREYNSEKYPRVLAAVRETLEAGERDLTRILGRVCLKERGPMTLATSRDVVIAGQKVHAPMLFAAGGVSAYVVEALAETCSDATDMVIELGAGWGRNLLLLYLSGRIPVATRLCALEFAETARLAGTLIASAVPTVPLTMAAFDYHAPDYSVIPPSDAPTVVATIHSAEQIPALSADVFRKLIGRRPRLKGLHLEPVSFQIPADRRGSTEAMSSAAHATQHDYNRNLWRILASLETDGVIAIDKTVPDEIGLNPSNPSTLITWRSKSES